MSAVVDDISQYRSAFESREQYGSRNDPPWLPVHRRAAIERFEDLGFPTTRLEAWQNTSVAPVARGRFEPVSGTATRAAKLAPELLSQLVVAGVPRGQQIVLVNGHFEPTLSNLDAGTGVTISGLADALRETPHKLESHLLQVSPDETNAFAALNTALFEDGACILIESGVVVAEPIQLFFVSTPVANEAVQCHPRTLIVAGRGSQCTLVETYVGPARAEYWTNAVTEIVLEEHANVDHYKLQCESEVGYHIATLSVDVGRSARFFDHSLCLGGALARNDVRVRLAGEGAECDLDGLFVGRGVQHLDTHTLVDHVAPHCSSRELYKGVLGGMSHGVFHGRLVVRPGAQKTDAVQANKNLLLTKHALVDSTPQLEIFADDVKCRHGATIGQLDAMALFYLRSRGLSEEAARRMLTYAFASDIVDRLRVPVLRDGLQAFLQQRLPSVGREDAA
jgi:Fe-S cluster assembly protein SufD